MWSPWFHPGRVVSAAVTQGTCGNAEGTAPGKGPPLTACWRAGVRLPATGLEVHVTAAGGGRCLLLFRLLGDYCLGREEQTGNGGSVLQRGTSDLCGVNNPGLEHVVILAGRGVEAVTLTERAHLLGHHAALEAGVDRDLLERLLDRLADDGGTGRLVARQVELLEGVDAGLEQRHATTGHDTFLDRGL